ncbi:hypothetical protein CB1_000931017 [Camelus ferus]|nr:hypothetical protein CB1_000931017 [Camelus ferus]
MLMPLSGLLWWWWCCCFCAWYCCGLCTPAPQMLRHQGLLKCRCRMLFNDLKVFLLRRPPPAPLPMHSEPQLPGLAANNNTLPALGAGGWAGWRGPREGVGRETPPLPPPPPLPPSLEDDWGGPATEPPASLLSSASSDDFCKGKAEDRYSLGSSLDSGMRTPLCRICFQGPEQAGSGLHVTRATRSITSGKNTLVSRKRQGLEPVLVDVYCCVNFFKCRYTLEPLFQLL